MNPFYLTCFVFYIYLWLDLVTLHIVLTATLGDYTTIFSSPRTTSVITYQNLLKTVFVPVNIFTYSAGAL